MKYFLGAIEMPTSLDIYVYVNTQRWSSLIQTITSAQFLLELQLRDLLDCYDNVLAVNRPHLQIPGGPKMARAALRRRAIDGPFAVMWQESRVMPVCCFAARWATFGPYRPLLDGPLRRAKNGPSQMRRPGRKFIQFD